MQNRYTLWQNLAVLIICILGFIYAIPNIFVDEPAIQLSPVKYGHEISPEKLSQINNALDKSNINVKDSSRQAKDVFFRLIQNDPF